MLLILLQDVNFVYKRGRDVFWSAGYPLWCCRRLCCYGLVVVLFLLLFTSCYFCCCCSLLVIIVVVLVLLLLLFYSCYFCCYGIVIIVVLVLLFLLLLFWSYFCCSCLVVMVLFIIVVVLVDMPLELRYTLSYWYTLYFFSYWYYFRKLSSAWPFFIVFYRMQSSSQFLSSSSPSPLSFWPLLPLASYFLRRLISIFLMKSSKKHMGPSHVYVRVSPEDVCMCAIPFSALYAVYFKPHKYSFNPTSLGLRRRGGGEEERGVFFS